MIVLVGSHQRARHWCRDERINPRSRDVVVVSDAQGIERLMGLHGTEGDRVVRLGDARDESYIADHLRAQGFPA